MIAPPRLTDHGTHHGFEMAEHSRDIPIRLSCAQELRIKIPVMIPLRIAVA
jgi:hypothetical protein